MVNRARAFIYSTAPSPLMAAAVRAALKICAGADAERAQLHALVRACGRVDAPETGNEPSGSQVQPIIVGDDLRRVRLAAALAGQGP